METTMARFFWLAAVSILEATKKVVIFMGGQWSSTNHEVEVTLILDSFETSRYWDDFTTRQYVNSWARVRSWQGKLYDMHGLSVSHQTQHEIVGLWLLRDFGMGIGAQYIGLESSHYMGVSISGGTPKSSILMGYSLINHPAIGIPPFVEILISLLIPTN